MHYFFDTEFVEDGSTIMPISIGIVAEDGRELYLEFDFDEAKANAHDFVRNNVLPFLAGQERYSRAQVRERILSFVEGDGMPVFWAWYAAYDWVLMCQIFGTMMDLPTKFPMYVRDLKQTCAEHRIPKRVLPKQCGREHHALDDARWLRDAWVSVTNWRKV